jgi:hypothetical protein
VNFCDAHRLASKDGAEINFFAAQTDAAATGDDNGLVVEGLIDIGQSFKGAEGRLIDLGRSRGKFCRHEFSQSVASSEAYRDSNL